MHELATITRNNQPVLFVRDSRCSTNTLLKPGVGDSKMPLAWARHPSMEPLMSALVQWNHIPMSIARWYLWRPAWLAAFFFVCRVVVRGVTQCRAVCDKGNTRIASVSRATPPPQILNTTKLWARKPDNPKRCTTQRWEHYGGATSPLRDQA